MKTHQDFRITKVKVKVIEKFRRETLKRQLKDKTFTQADLLSELLNV